MSAQQVDTGKGMIAVRQLSAGHAATITSAAATSAGAPTSEASASGMPAEPSTRQVIAACVLERLPVRRWIMHACVHGRALVCMRACMVARLQRALYACMYVWQTSSSRKVNECTRAYMWRCTSAWMDDERPWHGGGECDFWGGRNLILRTLRHTDAYTPRLRVWLTAHARLPCLQEWPHKQAWDACCSCKCGHKSKHGVHATLACGECSPAVWRSVRCSGNAHSLRFLCVSSRALRVFAPSAVVHPLCTFSHHLRVAAAGGAERRACVGD
eukprot:365270-Chlamydomonas_euryale.AAC.14